MHNVKCFGIAGWKNSGKTTLVSGLVQELVSRNLVISTIKHAHHAFDLDQPGTDSFRHREAGASEVVLSSANRWAIQHELNGKDELSLADLLTRLSPCDLVIVEGFKNEAIPKLEVIGLEQLNSKMLWTDDPNIMAIACEEQIPGCTLPSFNRSDLAEIADFILDYHRISC